MGWPPTVGDIPWMAVYAEVHPLIFEGIPGGCGLPPASWVSAAVAAAGCEEMGGGLEAAAELGGWVYDILFAVAAAACRQARPTVKWVASGHAAAVQQYGGALDRRAFAAAAWVWLLEGCHTELAMVLQWLLWTYYWLQRQV